MINASRSMLRRSLVFLLSAWLAIACHLPVQSQPNGLSLALQAEQLYRAGELTRAAAVWQEAATAFQLQGDRSGKTKSLIARSQVLQDLGLYPRACNVLLTSLEVEDPDCSPSQLNSLIQTFAEGDRLTTVEGVALRSLGNILQRQGMLEEAQTFLVLSLTATQNTPEAEATWLALGNVRQALGDRTRNFWSYNKITEIIDRQDPQLALQPYSEAFFAYQKVYQSATAPITQVQARLNHLSLLIELEDWWQQQTTRRIQSWQRLDQTRLVAAARDFTALFSARLEQTKNELISTIERDLAKLEPSHQGIYARINYAHSLLNLPKASQVESILQTAWQQSLAIEDKLGGSYALGYLGQYYGQQGKLSQAIALTNRALALATAENIARDVREVSYLWQSQLGRFLEQSAKTEEAIAAYTLAFDTLQSLRADLNANDRVVQFDFLQEVKPVYLQLANLLLSDTTTQAAKSLNTSSQADFSQNNLESARQVIESLQLAELDNFFQDPCLETTDNTVTIDRLDPQAAVIYPIVLRDRLEVILSIAGQPLQKFTSDVSATTVDRTIDLLYDSLFNPSIDNSAVNIFSTTPIDPREVTENTQRLLPTLQQIYSWSIEPLETELAANNIKTLVFVLSGKLQNVPMAALYDGKQYLLEKYSIALAPSLQLVDTQPIPRNEVKVLAAGLSQQVEIQGEIFPALRYVPEELSRIETIFPQSRKLLNQEFTASSIEEQLQAGFPVVHLATHGIFSSDPQQTFIVAGDRDIIDINTLSTLLNSSSIKPELIVLSACDTAAGDERAVLGLAGVAVRSGSTTIASLWSVDDASTAKLMSQFYREFKNRATKKVDALQQAQLSAIESLRTNPSLPELNQLPPHPYYWAPYVLVGNWQ